MALKDLFFESEQKQVQAVPVTQEVTFTPISPSVNTIIVQQNDATMIKRLYDCIIAHNLPGPDYLELKNIADALSKYVTDENARYSAAFETLKQQYPSLTKDIILNAIKTYSNLIESERTSGLQQCKEMFDKQDLSVTIQTKKSRADEIMLNIKQLQSEYDKITIDIKRLTDDNTKAKEQYEQNCAIFNSSVNAVLATLNSDMEKISKLNL